MQKLAEICVKRPVFATMLVMAFVVVGVFSYFSLGVDLTPSALLVEALLASSDAVAEAAPTSAERRAIRAPPTRRHSRATP